MYIAQRDETELVITETLTKYGLVTGATLEAAIFDPKPGVTNPWLADWTAGTWGPTKATNTLVEGDTGRYSAPANLSSANASSDRLQVFFEVTAGGTGGSQQDIALLPSGIADKDTLDSVLALVTAGGPGPWTTGVGNVPIDTIIHAINAATELVLAATKKPGKVCGYGEILPTIYTGHKGDQLIMPVYRNGVLMSATELENATQLSIEINNIADGTQLDIGVGVAPGPGGTLVYTTTAGDGAFETAGKWEYQSRGLTEQGAPFVSQRMIVYVYESVP